VEAAQQQREGLAQVALPVRPVVAAGAVVVDLRRDAEDPEPRTAADLRGGAAAAKPLPQHRWALTISGP
jgi:hypothetical protein